MRNVHIAHAVHVLRHQAALGLRLSMPICGLVLTLLHMSTYSQGVPLMQIHHLL